MSKYNPLWQYLRNRNHDSIVLSFNQIKKIISSKLDRSFLNYKKEALAYGYKIKKISLKGKKIIFVKTTISPSIT